MLQKLAISLCFLALCLVTTSFGQLSGAYTILPLNPTGGSNFASLADAVTALNTQGIAGPVTFEIFDDAGPYTETNSFVTANVQWAPSTAVLVLGQWVGSSPNNPVIFRAAPGESPVFDATGKAMGVFWNGADYVTIEGIEIFGAIFDGVSLYSETSHGQPLSPTIRRCRIHSCAASGVAIYGNTLRPQNTLVENNFFWNLQTTNAGGFNTTARFGYVSGRRHDFSRVINNTFFVNTAAGSGFAVIGDVPSGGTGSHYSEISGNIIVKTVNGARPIYSLPDNPAGVSGVPAIMESNCYFDTSGGSFSLGSIIAADLPTWIALANRDLTSLNADPLLAAPATGDLHLTALSPCIDAVLVSGGPVDDIDGELRTGVPDIGADELALCAVVEYQVNSAEATLTLDGLVGTPCSPAIVTKGQNLPTILALSGTLSGFGFDAGIVGAPLLPVSSGAFVTSNGQILNLNQGVPPMIFLIGGSSLSLTVPFPGNLVLPFNTPGSPLTATIQMVIVDPTHPDGARLSQGSELNVF